MRRRWPGDGDDRGAAFLSDAERAAAAVAIREATAADMAVCLELVRELAAYEREPDAVTATEADLRRFLFGEERVAGALLAEVEGAVAGFAVYCFTYSTWTGRPTLWLEDLFVRPRFRRLRAGRALLSALARTALERGCARMEWAVLDWNRPAIDFYDSLGARPLDEWTTHRLAGSALEALASG